MARSRQRRKRPQRPRADSPVRAQTARTNAEWLSWRLGLGQPGPFRRRSRPGAAQEPPEGAAGAIGASTPAGMTAGTERKPCG
jgi:hypothetical protein